MICGWDDLMLIYFVVFTVFLDVFKKALFIRYLKMMFKMVMYKELSDDDLTQFPLPPLPFLLLYVNH